MKVVHLFAAALFLVAVSCERHSWEDTKVLSETHGHGEHDEAAHEEGTGHDSDPKEHAETEGHDKDSGEGADEKPAGEAPH